MNARGLGNTNGHANLVIVVIWIIIRNSWYRSHISTKNAQSINFLLSLSRKVDEVCDQNEEMN